MCPVLVSLVTRWFCIGVSRTNTLVHDKRGEHNVPKRYLQDTVYATVGDDTGYFAKLKGAYFPIEFDFTHYFWYLVKYNTQKSCWESNKLPTEEYSLEIPNYHIIDRSKRGPINGAQSNHSDIEDNKSEGHPESIDIKIPSKEEEESKRKLEKLAESIPLLTRPRSNTATYRLPPITTVMSTQVMTEPAQTIATEGEASSAQRGGGPPGDAPDPRWFRGTGHPFNMPGGGGGGGGSGGDRGGNPDDQNHGPKLSGKEPVIFDGD